VAGFHGFGPGQHRGGCSGGGAGVPVFLGLLAERIGAALDGLVTSRREKREIAEDLELGKQAAREREEVIHVERRENQEHHPEPVLIEPVLAGRAQVRACRQGAAKAAVQSTCPTASCPRWTCSTARTAAPGKRGHGETLEMTSRMIEKKLRDFGVEVRVVLASAWAGDHPLRDRAGDRCERLADHVNLAKDLARSV
jgi:S-DNA-T family DNA segregation ATPase FtsK/SpoIIIE